MKARVYLVDDEQPVLDGLTVTLRKTMSEVEVCGTSRSGRDAIEGIAREKPDIVLMDVRMPGMSGLDTLREVRRLSPDTLPILLTAYERFDIAREAFSLGVFDYLVKPVEQEILIASLRGALARLSERKEAALRAAAARDELEFARPLLEAGFVYAAILGSPADTLLRSYARRLGVVAPEKSAEGLFAAIGRQKNFAPLDGEDVQALRSEIAYRLSCVVGVPLGAVLPVFVPAAEAKRAEKALPEALSAVPNASLRVAFGSVCAEHDLARSWSEAIRAFNRAAGDDRGGREKLVPGGPKSECDAIAAAGRALSAAMRGEVASANDAFAHWIASSESHGNLGERAALAGALVGALGGNAEDVLTAGASQAALAEGSDRDFASRAAMMLNVSLAGVTPEESANAAVGSDRRVRIVMNFIAEHYGEAISLEDAAELSGVSPAHLSRLLVAETGASFTDHLAERRIDRARRELAEGIRSVKEIAALCGYPDANYFSRAFKKIVGTTPSEYGNRHGRSIV